MLRRGPLFFAAGLGLALALSSFVVLRPAKAMFIHEVTLEHPIDAVWAAITRKAQVDKYYLAPLGADIAAAGDDIFYGTPQQKLLLGRVVALEAPRRLVHTFRFAGDSEPGSTVTYVLASAGKGTVLRIEHRGYAEGSERHADIAMGWPIITDGLAELLAGKR